MIYGNKMLENSSFSLINDTTLIENSIDNDFGNFMNLLNESKMDLIPINEAGFRDIIKNIFGAIIGGIKTFIGKIRKFGSRIIGFFVTKATELKNKIFKTKKEKISNVSADIEEAYRKGYKEGYDEGEEKGTSKSKDEYDKGYEAGKEYGYKSGRADEYQKAYKSGYDQGKRDESAEASERFHKYDERTTERHKEDIKRTKERTEEDIKMFPKKYGLYSDRDVEKEKNASYKKGKEEGSKGREEYIKNHYQEFEFITKIIEEEKQKAFQKGFEDGEKHQKEQYVTDVDKMKINIKIENQVDYTEIINNILSSMKNGYGLEYLDEIFNTGLSFTQPTGFHSSRVHYYDDKNNIGTDLALDSRSGSDGYMHIEDYNKQIDHIKEIKDKAYPDVIINLQYMRKLSTLFEKNTDCNTFKSNLDKLASMTDDDFIKAGYSINVTYDTIGSLYMSKGFYASNAANIKKYYDDYMNETEKVLKGIIKDLESKQKQIEKQMTDNIDVEYKDHRLNDDKNRVAEKATKTVPKGPFGEYLNIAKSTVSDILSAITKINSIFQPLLNKALIAESTMNAAIFRSLK